MLSSYNNSSWGHNLVAIVLRPPCNGLLVAGRWRSVVPLRTLLLLIDLRFPITSIFAKWWNYTMCTCLIGDKVFMRRTIPIWDDWVLLTNISICWEEASYNVHMADWGKQSEECAFEQLFHFSENWVPLKIVFSCLKHSFQRITWRIHSTFLKILLMVILALN